MIDSMSSSDGTEGLGPAAGVTQTTGRYVVVFADVDIDSSEALRSIAGVSAVASSRDFDDQAVDMAEAAGAEAVALQELGIAVVAADPDQVGALQTSAQARGNVVAVVPELIHHVMPSSDYVGGYVDGVTDLAGRLGVEPAEPSLNGPQDVSARVTYQDTDQLTWGLQATLAASSGQSGRGVRVAVLDTGMDIRHPDFVGRSVTPQSFVAGESVEDGHGHGTHCIGTACGPQAPTGSRRYGVAYEADIWVGKVLSNQGSGSDGGILAGINWAVANGVPSSRCRWVRTCPGSTRPTTSPAAVRCSAAASSSRPPATTPTDRATRGSSARPRTARTCWPWPPSTRGRPWHGSPHAP